MKFNFYSSLWLGIAFSLIFGFASYYFIEKRKFSIKNTLFIVALSLIIHSFFEFSKNNRDIDSTEHGMKYDLRRNERELFMNEYSRPECNFKYWDSEEQSVKFRGDISESCITKVQKNNIFIWGDSHAQHLYYGLKETLNPDIGILQVATFSCRTSDFINNQCKQSNERALSEIDNLKPDTIIICQRNHHNKINVELLKKLSMHSKIIIIGPSPEWDFEAEILNHNNDLVSRTTNNLDIMEGDKLMQSKIDSLSSEYNIEYISMFDELCSDNKFLFF